MAGIKRFCLSRYSASSTVGANFQPLKIRFVRFFANATNCGAFERHFSVLHGSPHS